MARNSQGDAELFSVFSKHSDSVRRSMFLSSHINQAIPVVDSDTNPINSVYSQIWHSGDTFQISQTDTKIIKKFRLMEHTFILINNFKDKVIDLHFVDQNNNGFKYKDIEPDLDNVKKEGEIIYEQGSENRLFSIGKVANVAVSIHKELFEDTIAISKSFAEKLSHIESKTFNLKIYKDVEFVNQFGDDENFIPIADNAKGVTLTTRRRSDINFASFSKSKMAEPNIFRDFKTYDGEGKTFIDVYINPAMNPIKTPTWDYLKMKSEETLNRMREFCEMVEEFCKDDHKTTLLVFNLYNYYKDLINGVSKYNKVEFKDTAILKITLDNEVKFTDGSKLTNLCGTKGLTKILEDSEMLTDEKGKPVDVLIDTTTIIGRMNLSQIREMEVNKIIDLVQEKIDNTINVEEKVEILYDFLDNTCKLQLRFDEELMRETVLDPNFKVRAITEEIPNSVYNEHAVDLYKQLYYKGKPQRNKVLVGKKYILKLKHVANKKSSAVALPSENSSGKPVRSNKKELMKLSDQPSSLGSMELSHLRCVGLEVLEEINVLRGRNKTNRVEFAKHLINSENISIHGINKDKTNNPSSQLFDETLVSMGITLKG